MQDGTREKFFAKVVVDATGQSAMLSNKFRWRVRDPKLKKAVLYSYLKDVHREPDLNGGATLVLRTNPAVAAGSGTSRSRTTSRASALSPIPNTC